MAMAGQAATITNTLRSPPPYQLQQEWQGIVPRLGSLGNINKVTFTRTRPFSFTEAQTPLYARGCEPVMPDNIEQHSKQVGASMRSESADPALEGERIVRGWFGNKRIVHPREDVCNPATGDPDEMDTRRLRREIRPPHLDYVHHRKRCRMDGEYAPNNGGHSEATQRFRSFKIDNLRYEDGGRKMTRTASCPPSQSFSGLIGHLDVSEGPNQVMSPPGAPPRTPRRFHHESSAHHCHSPSVREILTSNSRNESLIERERRKETDVTFAKVCALNEQCSEGAKKVGKSTADRCHHTQSSQMAGILDWAN